MLKRDRFGFTLLQGTYWSALKWLYGAMQDWALWRQLSLPCPYGAGCDICDNCGQCIDHGRPCHGVASNPNEFSRPENVASGNAPTRSIMDRYAPGFDYDRDRIPEQDGD